MAQLFATLVDHVTISFTKGAALTANARKQRLVKQVYYRAAGGVVCHGAKVLLLDRPGRGEVRLPKGHIEEGELPPEAALREVQEETGYAHLAIVADLGTQQVRFVDPYRKRRIIREDRFFLMRLRDERRVQRAPGEQQFIPVWVRAAAALGRLTFAAEQEFVRRALCWLEANQIPFASIADMGETKGDNDCDND